MLNIGDYVPDLLGTDAEGKEIRLSTLGLPAIIYFYPKDMTPGCTAEACSLQEGYTQLKTMGYSLVGVSADSAQRHSRFAERNGLTFPLVSDTDHRLCEAFGVWRLKKMAGREYMGIVRTTFVVGADSRITDVIEKVDTRHAAEQLYALLEGRGQINP